MTHSGMRRRVAALLSAAVVAALGTVVVAPAASADTPTELFFSEYIEGSSNNKALEIYNGTGGAVDLATGAYNVQMFFNGSSSAGLTINLTGTVADGDVFVLAQSSANATVLAQADQTNGAGWFNGDDAVVLRKGTAVVDAIGQIGFDPGSEWGSGLTSTADNTLRRKADICAGDPDGSDAFDPATEWDGFATDTFDGLGAHTANCSDTGPADPVINDFSASTAGTDVEYVEIFGDPGTDYSAYTVLEIEGDTTGAGVVDEVIALGTTDANGLYLVNLPANALENGTISLLLVEDFTGALTDDLDTDNDGVFDVTPWAEIVDSVAVDDGGAGDITYGAPSLGVSYDGLPYAPGGASRIPDGWDTDSATDWVRNDFDLAGIPGYTGTPVVGEAYNTPGAANAVVVEAAPAVASTTPADGATGVAITANLTVEFTEPVDVTDEWFTLSCTTSGTVAATVSGGPSTYTIDPDADLAYEESCTLTIVAANVTDQDTIDPPNWMDADHVVTFDTAVENVCSATYTPIYDIQGSGPAAAIAGTVTTEGVVVGDYEGPTPALRGFYLQDLTGDGDSATSDGIFVFNGNTDSVSLGDVVRVTGSASEFQGQTQISANPSLTVLCGTGSVDPVDVTFPRTAPDDLEPFEGMLVTLSQTMYVTEHFQLGRFGQVVVSSGGRLQQPTNVVEPGAPALELQAANNLNRIIIDDALNNQNPDPILFGREGFPLSAENTLRGGDTATDITGVMTYTWAGNSASGNAFRVRPINALDGYVYFEPTNPRPATAPEVGGSIQAAGLNLLNYFNTFSGCTAGVGGLTTDCRGAENETEFIRQWQKTVSALVSMDADVVGIVEIENDGYGPDSAIADLVDRLNAATAPGTWAFIDADDGTGEVNALGTDAIKVGAIYRPGAVTPVGTTAALNTPEFVTGGDLEPRNRPALAQAFRDNETGGVFTAVVNHLKSKGGGCDIAGIDDGQGECNLVRLEAAELLAEWLQTDPTGTGDSDILIVGDLNSYAMEDPIMALQSAGYTNLIREFSGPDAYSYVFDGQWGYLDHALGSETIVDQVTGVAEYHINADEPSVLDYNTNFKSTDQIESLYAPDQFRMSDHDPVIVGLNLENADPVIEAFTVTPSPVMVGDTVTAAATFTNADLLDTHTATIDWGDGSTPADGVVVDADGSGTVNGTHAYMAAGFYTVTLTVLDEWGNEDTSTAEVIVYDPDAGFLVGGGWYNSPTGSLIDSPSWKGKATFGLSVKYESGMAVPTGNLDFNLVGAPFKAYATGFDWLVVSGDTAWFAGTAMVNGMDGYTFHVTVTDGGKRNDTIAIVIRDASDEIVYDSLGSQPVKGQLTLQQTS